MSEHSARVSWERGEAAFDYASYDRNHRWEIAGQVIKASAAPDFHGDATMVDPEAAFVASLASCHMLTLLALCSKKKIVVDRYQDRAVGYLEKNEAGKLAVTRVVLRPEISFAGQAPSAEEVATLHRRSHEMCFIANSVLTKIEVQPQA